MRVPAVALLVALIVPVGACTRGGQTGDEGSMAGSGGRSGSGGSSSGSGGINMMPGEFECTSDAECGAYAQDLAGDLERSPSQRGLALKQARCISGCAQPTACACLYAIPGRDFLDGVNVLVLGGSTDCDVYGRAPYCLAPANEFSGCETNDPASCDQACSDALGVLDADQTGYEVELRTADCTEQECRWVWRLNDRCFAATDETRNGSEFSCTLSDDEIFELAFPPDAGDSVDAGAADAGGEQSPADGAVDAGAAMPAQGAPSGRTASEGPEEPNWRTVVEDGRTWATAEVCGQELEPVCVSGDCSGAELDAGSAP